MENHRHTHRTHTIVLPFATVLRVVCVCVCVCVCVAYNIYKYICPNNLWYVPKLSHVSGCMHDVLYWLPAEQSISYRIASLVCRCLLGLSPVYFPDLCCPLLSAVSSRSFRSSQQGLILVSFARTSAKERGAFSVAAPRPGKSKLLKSIIIC